MVVSAVDLECGIGSATLGMSLVDGVDVVGSHCSESSTWVVYRRNWGKGVPLGPHRGMVAGRTQFDLAFVHRWTPNAIRFVTQCRSCRWVVSTAPVPGEVCVRLEVLAPPGSQWDWASVDVDCSRYLVPQARVQRMYIGIRDGDMDAFLVRLESVASMRPAIVRDCLPPDFGSDTYTLPPVDTSLSLSRCLYCIDYPAPHLKKTHWPLVAYKPGLTDCIQDPHAPPPVPLELSHFMTLQGFPSEIDFPEKSRRQIVELVVECIPPPVVTAVVHSLLAAHGLAGADRKADPKPPQTTETTATDT